MQILPILCVTIITPNITLASSDSKHCVESQIKLSLLQIDTEHSATGFISRTQKKMLYLKKILVCFTAIYIVICNILVKIEIGIPVPSDALGLRHQLCLFFFI